MFLLTSDEIKAIEQCAIETYEIPGLLLMEHAGSAVADLVKLRIDKKSTILIVSGCGNNGGDGFVVARKLYLSGYKVKVIIIGDPIKIKGDALTQFKILNNLLDNIDYVVSVNEFNEVKQLILESKIIVDAIFGTGLHTTIRTLESSIIDVINHLSSKTDAEVISVDIPSGIDSNSGKVLGNAVKASLTVSFDSPKCGNILYPGADYNGDLKVVSIGIPDKCYTCIDLQQQLITQKIAKAMLPKRMKNGHKGTFGKASFVAGSFGMEGAAILSCSAAMRTGVGLIKLFVPKSINGIIKTAISEVVTIPLDEAQEGIFGISSVDVILEGVRSSDVVAIGSGSGMHSEVGMTVRRLISESTAPLVIDADGLNILAKNMEWLDARSNDIVLTPHIKEMARLTNLSVVEILDDPINITKTYATKWGVTVILKSARTIISSPEGHIFVNCTGNSGMATAGTGDVLTGIITAFIAQGMTTVEASVLGVYLHGCSGDVVASQLGEYGLLASDLVKQLPYAFKALYDS